MSSKKNKKTTFEDKHKPNKLKNNKVFPIVVIIFAFVLVSVLAVISIRVDKNKSIDLNYQDYTTVTAPSGQEYTTFDNIGNKFIVKDDGMYCDTDYGLVKVEYNKPLNKFNSYSYDLYSGANTYFTLNKDGTYTYCMTYSDGSHVEASGEYQINIGINSALKTLNITDAKEFSDAFLYDVGALNPNDLFTVKLKYGTSVQYDSDNNKIEESVAEASNSTDNFDDNSNLIIDELVIFIYKDKENQVQAIAYDVTEQLLFNENEVNGTFTVEYTE